MRRKHASTRTKSARGCRSGGLRSPIAASTAASSAEGSTGFVTRADAPNCSASARASARTKPQDRKMSRGWGGQRCACSSSTRSSPAGSGARISASNNSGRSERTISSAFAPSDAVSTRWPAWRTIAANSVIAAGSSKTSMVAMLRLDVATFRGSEARDFMLPPGAMPVEQLRRTLVQMAYAGCPMAAPLRTRNARRRKFCSYSATVVREGSTKFSGSLDRAYPTPSLSWPGFSQRRSVHGDWRLMDSTILLIENEPESRAHIAANLRQAGHRALCAADVAAAELLLRGEIPDLVMLEWILPDTPGVTFARRLRSDRRTMNVPIIVVTARTQESDKVVAFEAGVDDYVTKPFSPRELLARVKALMRRCAPQRTDEIAETEGLRVDCAMRRVTCDGREIELGNIDFRMLHFFMTRPGRIHSRARLLDEVWGEQVGVEERTVDVHVRKLRQALARTGRDRLIDTVRGVGYRFHPGVN